MVGDPTYGGRRSLSDRALGAASSASIKRFSRQALHAATLAFEHPVTGEALEFEAKLPADLAGLVDSLSAKN